MMAIRLKANRFETGIGAWALFVPKWVDRALALPVLLEGSSSCARHAIGVARLSF